MKRLRNEAVRLGKGAARRTASVTVPLLSGERTENIVYFCRVGDCLKVGFSTQGRKRYRDHFAHRPTAVRGTEQIVLAVVAGGRIEEDLVHRAFREQCHPDIPGGEWFTLDAPLLDYIRWLRDQYFVEVGEDWPDGEPRTAIQIDSDGWVPRPERTKPSTTPLLGPAFFAPRRVTGDDYYTDKALLESVRAALGGQIDLDPASHPVANMVVKANRFYGKTENGLVQPWYGTIWLNPPFDQWPDFAEKIVQELQHGAIRHMLALVALPALSTQYLTKVLSVCDLLILLRGRESFWGPLVDGGAGAGAAQGTALLYFGPDRERVTSVFTSSAVVFNRSCI